MQYPHCTSLTLPGAASQEATFPHPPPVGVHPMAPLLVLTGGIPCFFVNSSQLFTRTHTRFAGMKLYPDSDRKSAMERVSATVVAHGAPETRATVRPAGSFYSFGTLALVLLLVFVSALCLCVHVCVSSRRKVNCALVGQAVEAHGIYDKLTDEALYTGAVQCCCLSLFLLDDCKPCIGVLSRICCRHCAALARWVAPNRCPSSPVRPGERGCGVAPCPSCERPSLCTAPSRLPHWRPGGGV